MTKITHRQNGGQHTLTLLGHAEYGERGKDIVCASISSVVNVMVLALLEDDTAFVSIEAGDCLLRWQDHDEIWRAVDAAFFHLAREFPENISYSQGK